MPLGAPALTPYRCTAMKFWLPHKDIRSLRDVLAVFSQRIEHDARLTNPHDMSDTAASDVDACHTARHMRNAERT